MEILLKNNLRLKQIPQPLYTDIVDRLQFNNPRWLENRRMGRWNRGVPRVLKFYDKIRPGGLRIPRGFMRELILMCRRMDVACQVEDRRRLLPEVEFEFSGRLRPFQQTAVRKMLAKDFGTLSAPTGGGKTVMALFMVSRRRQPALVVVHNRDLADQWIRRTEELLNIPKSRVGYIGGGRKSIGDGITIALVQSLYKCADEVSKQIGFLIVDECHRCPSRTFTEAVVAFDSHYMLGLSATPWRRDNLSRLIFWHLGDVHHEVEKSALVQSGDVLPTKVNIRETDFEPFHDPVTEYSKMLSELTANDRRNRLIADDVAKEVQQGGGVCLVLSDRKKHCDMLQAILRYKHHIDARVFTGDLSDAERRHVLDLISQGRVQVLVATGQLIGEGFDNRRLSSLFLATPVRFSGRVMQYVGRVMRPGAGKKHAVIYDYVDVKVDVLNASAKARMKVYRK